MHIYDNITKNSIDGHCRRFDET